MSKHHKHLRTMRDIRQRKKPNSTQAWEQRMLESLAEPQTDCNRNDSKRKKGKRETAKRLNADNY